jgi:hypothetical protein
MKRRIFLSGSIGLAAGLPAHGEPAVPRPRAVNLVTTSRREWQGLDCLAVELTDDEQQLRLCQAGGGNRASIAIVHDEFTDGALEVTIGAELTGKEHRMTGASPGCRFTWRPTSPVTRPSTCA